ncbi:MAG TPA: TlpA disulfide reductase family protein [Polyangiaceae bacterium]|nr:TlpA disulfide reductase family protein [Polyangiaceae bacterium]
MRSALGFFVSLVSCSCGAGMGGGHAPSGDGHAMVGVHAPGFSRPGLFGGGTLSPESAKGKVLIVDFWATYCKPCEKSFPRLQALADRRGGSLVVYALSEDESKDGIAAFVKKTGVRFPIGWDDGNSVSPRYKLDKMPTSYVVDKKGIIRFVHGGYGDGEEEVVGREVEQLLR